eukprot:gene3556-6291_t
MYYKDSIEDFDLLILISPSNKNQIQIQKEVVLERIEESKIAGNRNLQMYSKLDGVDIKNELNFDSMFKNPKIVEILNGMNENSNQQELNDLMKDENIFETISSLNKYKSRI